ncbi:Alpha/Beta hydrolase protein [Coniella lustricola]|uniref:Alpha/Beta hydrolase protein n=1 Tax=Coniella lustricola TaxID=2025994 RepID=A0A2T3ACX0_9PEZI|nr:Alpha/Beta hydrolase protein [Coniella lustricola]
MAPPGPALNADLQATTPTQLISLERPSPSLFLELEIHTIHCHGSSEDSDRPISYPHANDLEISTHPISSSLFSSLERFARLVDIAYCVGTSGVYQPFTCASRCKEFPNLELASTWNTGALLSDSCGYVAVDHGSEDGKEQPAIIVAFRGTYSLTNTVIDLSTIPQEYVPYPDPDEGSEHNREDIRCTNCTVHMGFLESWKQARRLVMPVIKNARARHKQYPIRLVGHSLGGAVACLAALEMKAALGWQDVHVTTFGEPQLGNTGFVEFVDRVFDLVGQDNSVANLEKQTYQRVTHLGDPVPLLPLSEWGYESHAGEIFINKSNLSPERDDVRLCDGDTDEDCITGGNGASRLMLWQLLFAHRDYFWRLGLCVPGGDPSDWGRPPYNMSLLDEL